MIHDVTDVGSAIPVQARIRPECAALEAIQFQSITAPVSTIWVKD